MANERKQTTQNERKQTIQNVAWFYDLHTRNLLDLDPPFQRRSVWTDKYREDFVDTVLMNYPAPAIFLFPNIDETGHTDYAVVDGKQRLETIFHFIQNRFAIGEKSPLTKFRGLYFSNLTSERRVEFFKYDFSVEMLSTNNATVIDSIFDRLNRNVAKLTHQELRHARYDGLFINTVEELASWMTDTLPKQFPKLSELSRNQMKDVEIVGILLLLLEHGRPKSYSQTELDAEYAYREDDWETQQATTTAFRNIIMSIRDIVDSAPTPHLEKSRFRNQADFYSLFGAIAELDREERFTDGPSLYTARLMRFISFVSDDIVRPTIPTAREYYDAARSASNDAGPRATRIAIIKRVLLDEDWESAEQ